MLYREGNQVLCPTDSYQSVLGRSRDSTPVWMVLRFQEFITSPHNLHKVEKPDWQIHILQGTCFFQVRQKSYLHGL